MASQTYSIQGLQVIRNALVRGLFTVVLTGFAATHLLSVNPALAGAAMAPPTNCSPAAGAAAVGAPFNFGGCSGVLANFLSGIIGNTSGDNTSNAVNKATDTALGGNTGAGANTQSFGADLAPGSADPQVSVTPETRMSVWMDLAGTAWDGEQTADGDQINFTAGIGQLVNPDLVVGVFGGYESYDYASNSVLGDISGDGATIGVYAGWQATPDWRLSGHLGWSRLDYDVRTNIGGAGGIITGSYDADRIMASLTARGSYQFSAGIFEPLARIYALQEDHDAWIDSTGFVQAASSDVTGRGTIGGTWKFDPVMVAAGDLSPYVGVFGDYLFGDIDEPFIVGGPTPDGLSGRVVTGFTLAASNGYVIGLDGQIGLLGSGEFTSYTGSLNVTKRF
ncbi:MAG: autotransporter outer membrane beta-barrel domain-containing protein [Pseudomonadota bacterium]